MQFTGWAAPRAGAALEPHRFVPAPLGPHDVEIEVTHCGVCRSDLHLVDNDWMTTRYPVVPGHEVVGRVVAAGPASPHNAGARLGVGWQCGACLRCAACLRGEENLCAAKSRTCVGRPGGFAGRLRVDGRFAFAIPGGLSSEHAAPLMCAGLTVYSPLRSFAAKGPARIAVIGLGGLGHLAVQFAAALGCDVAVFSTHSEKERDARRFGASRFVLMDSLPDAGMEDAFALILVTAPADLDAARLLRFVAPGGRLCYVSAPPTPLRIPVHALMGGRKSLTAGSTGSRADAREMLAFAVDRGVRPEVERLPFDSANQALDRLRKREARYRIVLAR